MPAIISAGADGATGSHTATGVTQVIASGTFNGASVQINVAQNSQPPAPAFTFSAAGAITLQTASGAAITAIVRGSPAGVAAVTVTCNP